MPKVWLIIMVVMLAIGCGRALLKIEMSVERGDLSTDCECECEELLPALHPGKNILQHTGN